MKGQSRESKEQRKKGSAFIILVLFMCVLATVAAVILISSPTISVQYKDIGGVVIDKQHAMIDSSRCSSAQWYRSICSQTSSGVLR